MKSKDPIFSMYINDIQKIPVLSHEEQIELIKKAQKGDKAAKEKIINSNLRFVVKIALKYKNQGLDILDLISEGNIGLMYAIDKFEVSRGYHFISYAVWWIRQSILKSICEKSRAIRLPSNKVNELVRIEHAKKSIIATQTEQQEFEEIAKMLNMDASYIRELIYVSRDMLSLDSTLPTSDDGITQMSDYQEDKTYLKPEDLFIKNSMSQDINSMLETLRPNEAKVIRLRYGLTGLKPMSLKEVGEECNLTKERIRQIEKHALVRLQHPSRSKYLEAYVA